MKFETIAVFVILLGLSMMDSSTIADMKKKMHELEARIEKLEPKPAVPQPKEDSHKPRLVPARDRPGYEYEGERLYRP